MNLDSLFWVVTGGLLATCFAAIGARSLRQFSRHELEEICRRQKARELFGEILRTHDRVAQGVENLVVLASALLVVAGTFWVAIGRASLATSYNWVDLLLNIAVWGLALSAAALWIPWAVARLWSTPFLFHTWRVWRLTAALAAPLVACARLIDVLLHRLAGRTPETPSEDSFEEEIRTIVTEGHREGLLEEDAREMIEGVMDLGDAEVSQIMTPRTDMHMLQVALSWEELVENVIRLGHTRIPVFDKNRDDIVGILHAKDLLPELAKGNGGPQRPITEILRKPYFVPETKAVDDLLQEFQQTRNHMAVVLDEYGGVSGLVTIEDVLEEIVGEIVDEYDEDIVEEIKQIDDTTFEALGRAHVDEVNEQMGLEFPDDGDFDTIGGFVFGELGRIPTVGESLVWQNTVRLTVLEASHRRIERVRIERLDQQSRDIA